MPISILLTGNSFDCNQCVLKWILPVKNIIGDQITCNLPLSNEDNCTIGISTVGPDIIYGPFGKKTIIPCISYGNLQPTVQWWLFRPSTYLGSFNRITGFTEKGNGSKEILERYSILSDGALLIRKGNRATVERYVCAVTNGHQSAYRIFKFRLDYSNWYSLDVFHSVFLGGVATAILVCAFSFLLNVTWIVTKKSILWWIQRAERLSRVRKMVEAMEKYKTRQMESLHDKYAKRMQLVEQLRVSYTSQAERFRDYRAAQMESMTSHLENIRDNYNQQMHRVREYGSKRAEQLWESYERQVNRMKAFSLQHRLKMMRQYKVKQRYLNKLLESFQDTNSPEAMRKHEEEVRAALEFPYPPDPPHDPLSRSSSFYSLPEYVINDDGVLRPSPLIPSVRCVISLAFQMFNGYIILETYLDLQHVTYAVPQLHRVIEDQILPHPRNSLIQMETSLEIIP
uniref:Ig-like domain-containing protein n=1 Tax=Heterorhabditis bacteriophora TaxID=37862 RepID=A0A1I7XTH2_HETBA